MTDRPDRPAPLLSRRALLRAASVAAGVAVLGPAVVRAVPPPTPFPAVTWLPEASAGPATALPLPACRYADEPAAGDPRTDWATIVLDTVFALGSRDRPRRLVSVTRAGISSELGARIIPAAIDDLRALHDASVEAGAEVASGPHTARTPSRRHVFSHWVAVSSEKHARTVSARPGHSEHQLGTALDFAGAGDPTGAVGPRRLGPDRCRARGCIDQRVAITGSS